MIFRLNVIVVEMPPLRACDADLVRFADSYTKHFAAQCGRRLDGLSPEAADCIRAHSWPGNLRELRNAIERAVIMARGNKLFPDDFPAEWRNPVSAARVNGDDSIQIGSFISLEKLEEAHLRKIVERTSSLSDAAEILGIDQATLYRKRKKIGLE